MVDTKRVNDWIEMGNKDFKSANYVETRYPAEEPLIVTDDDTKETIEIAERIKNFVLNKI